MYLNFLHYSIIMSLCLIDEKQVVIVVTINNNYNIVYIFFNYNILERQIQRIRFNIFFYVFVVFL